MKIKNDFIVKEISGSTVVIPVGNRVADFNGMLKLNETGVFLFNLLKNEITIDVLVQCLVDEYEVTKEKANEDVITFVNKLKEADIIE